MFHKIYTHWCKNVPFSYICHEEHTAYTHTPSHNEVISTEKIKMSRKLITRKIFWQLLLRCAPNHFLYVSQSLLSFAYTECENVDIQPPWKQAASHMHAFTPNLSHFTAYYKKMYSEMLISTLHRCIAYSLPHSAFLLRVCRSRGYLCPMIVENFQQRYTLSQMSVIQFINHINANIACSM